MDNSDDVISLDSGQLPRPTIRPLPYSILSHTADTGIEATGESLATLIHELGTGMFSLMADLAQCRPDREIETTIEATSHEDLVVDALSELLYLSEVEDLFLCEFDVDVKRTGVLVARVTARGIPTGDVELTGPPVKAVTYHDITVTRTAENWSARVYFDV